MAASNGPIRSRAVGADGYDFEHRQKIAAQYQISAVNKSRLKTCIFLHFFLFLLMCAKLSESFLDYMDIFVMEIEELEIPKPHRWELAWTGCILFSFVGLSAVKRNRIGRMQVYMFGVIFGGLFPAIYAAIYYANDLWSYVSSSSTKENLEMWRGYPLAVLWYIFIVAAFQVHLFSIYFAEQLVLAWKARGVLKFKSH